MTGGSGGAFPPRSPVQLPLALSFPAAESAEDFLVAPCNQDAVRWLASPSGWPGPLLVLHGPPGCGKSHLLRLWAARQHAVTLTPALLADPESLLGPASTLQAGVLDDAQGLTHVPAAQRGLFHLYNHLLAHGGRLLLAAPVPPAAWDVPLADLASRLRGAAAVAIGAPDDATLAAVLLKLLTDRHLPPPAEVVAYLVPRMERSFSAAVRLATELDRATLAAQRPLTVPLARQVLAALEA